MNWFELIISTLQFVFGVFIVIFFILLIIWVFSLFFFPYKDPISQAFAELPKEWQDHVKENYQKVIVGKKTINELTEEMLTVETEEKK